MPAQQEALVSLQNSITRYPFVLDRDSFTNAPDDHQGREHQGKMVKACIKAFFATIDGERVPAVVDYNPPGTGKTTTCSVTIKSMQDIMGENVFRTLIVTQSPSTVVQFASDLTRDVYKGSHSMQPLRVFEDHREVFVLHTSNSVVEPFVRIKKDSVLHGVKYSVCVEDTPSHTSGVVTMESFNPRFCSICVDQLDNLCLAIQQGHFKKSVFLVNRQLLQTQKQNKSDSESTDEDSASDDDALESDTSDAEDSSDGEQNDDTENESDMVINSRVNMMAGCFDFLVIDEAHHNTHVVHSVMEKLSPKYALGMTATPSRSDAGKLFPESSFSVKKYQTITVPEAIEKGVLQRCIVTPVRLTFPPGKLIAPTGTQSKLEITPNDGSSVTTEHLVHLANGLSSAWDSFEVVHFVKTKSRMKRKRLYKGDHTKFAFLITKYMRRDVNVLKAIAAEATSHFLEYYSDQEYAIKNGNRLKAPIAKMIVAARSMSPNNPLIQYHRDVCTSVRDVVKESEFDVPISEDYRTQQMPLIKFRDDPSRILVVCSRRLEAEDAACANYICLTSAKNSSFFLIQAWFRVMRCLLGQKDAVFALPETELFIQLPHKRLITQGRNKGKTKLVFSTRRLMEQYFGKEFLGEITGDVLESKGMVKKPRGPSSDPLFLAGIAPCERSVLPILDPGSLSVVDQYPQVGVALDEQEENRKKRKLADVLESHPDILEALRVTNSLLDADTREVVMESTRKISKT